MAASVIVDAGFLVALLAERDVNHPWARIAARQHPSPWQTCEAALSESFYLLGPGGASGIAALLNRHSVMPSFHFADQAQAVLNLMQKYADVPMSFADACLVRMTEMLSDPLLLTTDRDFRIYRRHGRRTIPCALPG